MDFKITYNTEVSKQDGSCFTHGYLRELKHSFVAYSPNHETIAKKAMKGALQNFNNKYPAIYTDLLKSINVIDIEQL